MDPPARREHRKLHLFEHLDWAGAAGLVRRDPDDYWVLGFSAGASASTLKPFMKELRKRGTKLPTKIITVGLFDLSPRYSDPTVPVTNYLDASGQKHAGQPGCINLGAGVEHLDPVHGGMALVAAQLTESPKSVIV